MKDILKTIVSYYRKIGERDSLIKERHIIGDFFGTIPDISTDPLKSLDPKYMIPGSKSFDPTNWQQRKFVFGMLLIESTLERELKDFHEVDFIDENTIDLKTGNKIIENKLNIIIRYLLDPNDNSIKNTSDLKLAIQPIIFQLLGLKQCGSLWFSDLVKKVEYNKFLQITAKWDRSNESKMFDNRYLNDYGSIQENAPVSAITGYSARAYCNWFSKEYKIEPYYDYENDYSIERSSTQKKGGFRLFTEIEHESLKRSFNDYHFENDEIVDESNGFKICRGNSYAEWVGNISTKCAVFRFCITL